MSSVFILLLLVYVGTFWRAGTLHRMGGGLSGWLISNIFEINKCNNQQHWDFFFYTAIHMCQHFYHFSLLLATCTCMTFQVWSELNLLENNFTCLILVLHLISYSFINSSWSIRVYTKQLGYIYYMLNLFELCDDWATLDVKVLSGYCTS